MSRRPPEPPRGRGALSNPDNRFEPYSRDNADDGWDPIAVDPEITTTLIHDASRTVISRNDSPDVGFGQSVNPYRGCEHGCIYCFARPTHAYLGLSPGLDFESRIFTKDDAPELLKKELSHPAYRCEPLVVGINTDAYQPTEAKLKITRRILEVLSDANHPVSLVTKSSLVERDLDILAPMAARNLVHVSVSITTLEPELARTLEPRAAVPQKRIETLRTLSSSGIPVGVLVAPVIPFLTEHELEPILSRAREAGARSAGYALLRLPLELKDLFREWLAEHVPLSADHVMNRLKEFHGGKEYDSRFGIRMHGTGPFAELLNQRFRVAARRLGFPGLPPLDTRRFVAPPPPGKPKPLFPGFGAS
jgi:DNA repair photolyase